jgi:opacity protein-like surface antigen
MIRILQALACCLLGVAFLLPSTSSSLTAEAQQIRIGAGGGWAPAVSEVTYSASERDVEPDAGTSYGRHVYASVGFVRRLSSNFDLGVRLRAQESRFRADGTDLVSSLTECLQRQSCASTDPEGKVRALTVEGRIILTSLGRIDPYLLVGLGVVRTTMDGTRVQFEGQPDVPFSDIEVTDAGGDVGLGASMQLVGGLHLDGEFRVTGSLPGGKENAVTVLPLSLGLGYHFGAR